MNQLTNLATQIEQAFQQVLHTDADTLARQTGFIQRQRKLTGADFAQILLTTVLENPLPTCTDWAQTAALLGTPITPQGVDQRFTQEAAHFLQALLNRFVEQVITICTPASAPLLQRFEGVYIKDSTVISLPEALASVWQGVGGSAGARAAVKLQVRWNYSTGQLDGPALQPARCHDRTTPYGIEDLPAGSLELADLGYFCLEELSAQHARGQYFIRRYKVRVAVYTLDGEPLDLLGWLSQVETVGECRVLLGQAERVPVRLIAYRVSEERARRQRQRLYGYARRKGGTPTRKALALANWVVLVTNVPEERLRAEEVWVLARVRWQVEILFRVWKRHARIDAWRSGNVWRILCELDAKLMGVVVLHWLLLVARGGVWDRSVFKAARVLQKLSVLLAVDWRFGRGLAGVVLLFGEGLRSCRVNKRRRRPATFQLLLGQGGLN